MKTGCVQVQKDSACPCRSAHLSTQSSTQHLHSRVSVPRGSTQPFPQACVAGNCQHLPKQDPGLPELMRLLSRSNTTPRENVAVPTECPVQLLHGSSKAFSSKLSSSLLLLSPSGALLHAGFCPHFLCAAQSPRITRRKKRVRASHL